MTEALRSSRRIFVTGSTRGFGLLLAKRLVSIGCSVGLNGTIASEEACRLIESNSNCKLFLADVSDHNSVSAAIDEYESSFGAIDVLVNNAAYTTTPTLLLKGSPIQMEKIFSSIVMGTVFCTQKVVKKMRAKKKQGLILNISSVAVAFDSPGTSCYAAAKSAIEKFTSCMDAEIAHKGISVRSLRLPPLSGTGMAMSFSKLQQKQTLNAFGDIALPANEVASRVADLLIGQVVLEDPIGILNSQGINSVN